MDNQSEDKSVSKNIYIVGEVNESTLQNCLLELLEVSEGDDPFTNLNIYICSEGGALHECFAIIDLVNLIKIQRNISVTTIGLGEVASAGFFLFLLGDQRILLPNAKVFVHEHITLDPSPQPYGELMKECKTFEKELNQMYTNYTADRLDISVINARKLLRLNKWLNIKEISKYGLVTHRIKHEQT